MPDTFRDQNFPEGNKKFKCDCCDKVVDANQHNAKCPGVGCKGYFKIPVYP